jgi:hypothetical protein
MPIRQIPETDLRYYLIAYDETGKERRESDDSLLSDEALRTVAAEDITDVFLISHGWKGDMPAAIEQYDRWVSTMARNSGDRAKADQRPGGFKSLIIGLHWPSLPWGDENIPARGTSGMLEAGDESSASIEDQVEIFSKRIADTPKAREALRTIFVAAKQTDDARVLPPKVLAAYTTLFNESGLSSADVAGPPGSDQDGWDPQRIFEEARRGGVPAPGLLDLGDRIRDAILMPARQLSFWKMKDRARSFGETGGHDLLVRLQSAAPKAQFHLMGHSFGCIVVSATLAGTAAGAPLTRPVDSLFLVQGALSLWSYCPAIPHQPGGPGYFHRIVDARLVKGPIVTTRSKFDSAVGKIYPLGAELKKQLVLADVPPKYGGVGAFGAQGLGDIAIDMEMKNTTYNYGFVPGRVYNLEASKVIRNGGPPSGAHSDIAHPEVAHAMWAAALATKPA